MNSVVILLSNQYNIGGERMRIWMHLSLNVEDTVECTPASKWSTPDSFARPARHRQLVDLVYDGMVGTKWRWIMRRLLGDDISIPKPT